MKKWFKDLPWGLAITFITVLCLIIYIGSILLKVLDMAKEDGTISLDSETVSTPYVKFWEEFEHKAMLRPEFNTDKILSDVEYNLYLSEFLKRYNLTYIQNGKKLFTSQNFRLDVKTAKCYLIGYEYDLPFIIPNC